MEQQGEDFHAQYTLRSLQPGEDGKLEETESWSLTEAFVPWEAERKTADGKILSGIRLFVDAMAVTEGRLIFAEGQSNSLVAVDLSSGKTIGSVSVGEAVKAVSYDGEDTISALTAGGTMYVCSLKDESREESGEKLFQKFKGPDLLIANLYDAQYGDYVQSALYAFEKDGNVYSLGSSFILDVTLVSRKTVDAAEGLDLFSLFRRAEEAGIPAFYEGFYKERLLYKCLYMLGREYQFTIKSGFPMRKEAFDAMLEQYQQPRTFEVYIDEIDALVTVTDSYALKRCRQFSGMPNSVDAVTPEQTKALRTMIEQAGVNAMDIEYGAAVIICEEAQSYYQGAKSLEQVMEIIMGRLRMYQGERQQE